LKDIKKEFERNKKKKSYKVEEDIWGGLEKFCNKEEKKNKLLKKHMTRKTGRSEFWKI